MSDKPEVITTEVEASDKTVETIRESAPVGVAAKPLDRVSLDPGLAAMAGSGITSKRLAGTDRCIRVVDVPLPGGGTQPAHCFRACVRVGDMQLCPEHDKAAFQPTQTPVAKGRVINSASISLAPGEDAELRKVSKSYADPQQKTLRTVEPNLVPAQQTSPAPVAEDGVLTLRIHVNELTQRDVLEVLKARICDALDGLPCRNVREMKQIVSLQEKVAKLSKGGKRHVRKAISDGSTEG